MIKILNTTEEYEGHDKYIYLELEKTGKTLLLNYGGYTNIEYNRESNEITFDLDAFRDFIDNLLEEKTGRWMPTEYDGYSNGTPVWDMWECSECGYEHSGDAESLTAYCPNCGAEMKEGD